MREEGTIRTVYVLFICIELIIHLTTIATTTLLFIVISKRDVVHINLKTIMQSYFVSISLYVLVRTSWLILELLLAEQNIMDRVMDIRRTFLAAYVFHLYLMCFERFIATLRWSNYEDKSNLLIICLALFMLYLGGVVVSYANSHELKTIANVINFSTGTLTIACVVCNVLYNRHLLAKKRFQCQLSQNYSIRRNISLSYIQIRVFVYMIVAAVPAVFCIFKYQQAQIDNNAWSTIINGFVFDFCVSSVTALIPLIFINGDNELRRRALFIIGYGRYISKVSPIVAIHYVKGDDQGSMYFSQLEKAWA